MFAAAVAQHRAGAFGEAERGYRHILSLFPDHADSLHNLGLLALNGGDANAATSLIGRAIALNGGVAEYHYNNALAWRAIGRNDEAAAHLERAIALRPDHALAVLNLGNVRRDQARSADAVACYERALALVPNLPGANFNLANVLLEQNRWDAATDHYRKALALRPDHAEAHHRLGIALMALHDSRKAVAHFEAAIALKHDLPDAHEDLGAAYLAAGKFDLALSAAVRAIEHKETPRGKELFGQAVKLLRFTAESAYLRVLLLRAISEAWARPRELTKACVSIIALNPVVKDCTARAVAAWPARLDASELFGATAPAALAEDALLVCLLRCSAVADIGLERLLTNVRHIMLTAAEGDGDALDDRTLAFYAAVAQQCFINEYVYASTPAELEHAHALQSKLAQALSNGAEIAPLWPVAVAAYFPLHTLPGAEALLERRWPDCLQTLLMQQIAEPLRERQLASTIPALTAIGVDDVSRAVREQYEENPYPRWVKPRAATPALRIIPMDRAPDQISDVLIAGCGTGLFTIEFAQQMPASRILAVDLSLASLSYAKRMAEELQLANIEFAQADILELGGIGRRFDFIDVGGVLVTLADPWAGWKILLTLLRPGGTMQVGLYSEMARQNVVAVRAMIARQGYHATADDMRRCREAIITGDDPILKSVAQWSDFFTMSDCRDLLFHVQEHRFTLPQIKSFLATNGVQFCGFIPEPSLFSQFAARFPDRSALTDLDCWHTFESEMPHAFRNMYQFRVGKTA